ncbi:hypothetical protein [Murimonas intestini]|uniref:hypothetical protein n=1 Tax=Murimonas intestini TaxID=1337051 RepID=UPI001FAA2476|nr:hypothetical protein [Murimonas intestini]
MLVKIQQTKSNFENIFEVSSNGQVLFNAKAPWLKISAPFNMENLRKLVFSDVNGTTLYTTRYSIIDNALEESIPFKYLISKEQKFGQFEIIGKDGKEGTFLQCRMECLKENSASSIWEKFMGDTASIREKRILFPFTMKIHR